MKKYFICSILFAAIMTQGLYAWGFHTHRKITADAVRLMPEGFKTRFAKQKKSFLKGSTDPDILIKDFSNHVFHVDGSRTDGLYRIQALYNKAVELLRNNETDEKIAYVLGLMSHYIADLNQPLHTAGKARDPEEDSYHSKYESDVNRHLKNLQLPEISPNPVTSIDRRVREMAGEAFRHYDEIGMAYRNGPGLESVIKATDKQIYASMQNVVDFWCAVFKDARVDIESSTASATQSDWDLSTTDHDSSKKININRASAKEISDFFKISEARALQIVSQRPYRTAYDLAKTKVFSPMFIKRNKSKISVK
jgi:DNA uptake protein ComE-like DNA-binding protein